MLSMLTLKIITEDLIGAEQLVEQQKETTHASRRDSPRGHFAGSRTDPGQVREAAWRVAANSERGSA